MTSGLMTGGTSGDLLADLAILVLAGFVGFVVISKVPNTLHTPLVSGTFHITANPTNPASTRIASSASRSPDVPPMSRNLTQISRPAAGGWRTRRSSTW